jgi:hypothetical protein
MFFFLINSTTRHPDLHRANQQQKMEEPQNGNASRERRVCNDWTWSSAEGPSQASSSVRASLP